MNTKILAEQKLQMNKVISDVYMELCGVVYTMEREGNKAGLKAHKLLGESLIAIVEETSTAH